VPFHVTLPGTLPAKPGGTCQARPVRKISSLPEIGSVVCQVFVAVSKDVIEQLALGLNVISPLGTASE
jgi:hypothetical protein